MKREYERRYETAAEVGKRCAEARRRGEQVWLGRRFALFKITPATIAKRRLKEVIAADRRNVPCGRWEFAGYEWAPKVEGMGRRPYYRWSERR